MYVRQHLMMYILVTDIYFYWTPYVCHSELLIISITYSMLVECLAENLDVEYVPVVIKMTNLLLQNTMQFLI